MFTVDVSTNRVQGRADRTIQVATNDPDHPTVDLVVNTKVLIPLTVEPSYIVFQNVDRDADFLVETTTIRRGDGDPITPRVVGRTIKGVETVMREIDPGERYELDVKITRPYPNGALKAVLELATGIKEMPKVTFNILADIPERVELRPREFRLPRPIEEPVELSVELKWVGTTAYKVLRAEANVPELEARADQIDGRQFVVLTVPAGFERAKGTFPRVTVYTDDPELPTLLVPVHTARAGHTRKGPGARSSRGLDRRRLDRRPGP